MFEKLLGKNVTVKFKQKDKYYVEGVLEEENELFIQVLGYDGRTRILALDGLESVIESGRNRNGN